MDKYQKVAVHAFIEREDGKFLVTKRSQINDYLPGLYDLPGGTVEFGETTECALSREISEETSLGVKIFKPIYIYSNVQKGERHQFWVIYECKYIGGEIKLNPEEHDSFLWVDFDEVKSLPKIIFLEEFLKNNV